MILCFVSGAPLAESSSGFTLLGMKEKTAPMVVLLGNWRERVSRSGETAI
jgi:hypothetical protein